MVYEVCSKEISTQCNNVLLLILTILLLILCCGILWKLYFVCSIALCCFTAHVCGYADFVCNKNEDFWREMYLYEILFQTGQTVFRNSKNVARSLWGRYIWMHIWTIRNVRLVSGFWIRANQTKHPFNTMQIWLNSSNILWWQKCSYMQVVSWYPWINTQK